MSIDEEYFIVTSLGFKPQGQSLLMKPQPCNVLHVVDRQDNADFYFKIDRFFGRELE